MLPLLVATGFWQSVSQYSRHQPPPRDSGKKPEKKSAVRGTKATVYWPSRHEQESPAVSVWSCLKTTTTTARPKPVFIRRPNCCCCGLLFVLPLSHSFSSLHPPNFFFTTSWHHHSEHFTLLSTQLPSFTLPPDRTIHRPPLTVGDADADIPLNLRRRRRRMERGKKLLFDSRFLPWSVSNVAPTLSVLMVV